MHTVIVLETLILVIRINVGDAMLSNPLRCSGASRTDVSLHSDWTPSMRFLLLGSTASSQRSREQKQIYLTRLARNDDIICLQETHGKDEFIQAVQVLDTQFRLFGTFMLNNVNAGGSAAM